MIRSAGGSRPSDRGGWFRPSREKNSLQSRSPAQHRAITGLPNEGRGNLWGACVRVRSDGDRSVVSPSGSRWREFRLSICDPPSLGVAFRSTPQRRESRNDWMSRCVANHALLTIGGGLVPTQFARAAPNMRLLTIVTVPSNERPANNLDILDKTERIGRPPVKRVVSWANFLAECSVKPKTWGRSSAFRLREQAKAWTPTPIPRLDDALVKKRCGRRQGKRVLHDGGIVGGSPSALPPG